MAGKNVNTTESIQKPQKTDNELLEGMKRFSKRFLDEKQVEFSIPPQFQKHIGSTLFIGVNGSWVNVPVDGKTYKIPETFAKHGREVLKRLTT